MRKSEHVGVGLDLACSGGVFMFSTMIEELSYEKPVNLFLIFVQLSFQVSAVPFYRDGAALLIATAAK